MGHSIRHFPSFLLHFSCPGPSSTVMMHLRYNVAQSLDGFIAPPDESTSWIVPDESIDFDALHASFDYYVMGRRTWDIMRALEPNPCLNKPPGSIIVISRILRQEEHPHIAILREGYIEYIRRLKAKGGKGIWLMGGGWLAASVWRPSCWTDWMWP
ncbi:unnamed protein product [Clonostachys rosea f. rosea IK726]|uniref:Uncharacterized protein n=1 Tax=Clonostachys rosea f. rosea IK726 TaxID=1349383 RepID=A0ACA9UFB8_BIOOC|nr:unnamed protein product [Clonostachys rosea f. rosea IK726]